MSYQGEEVIDMNSPITEKDKSLWRIGKEDHKKFMSIRLSRKTNILSFLFGILFTAIIILPFTFIIFQVVELYWFSRRTMVLFLSIAWGLLMIANGLSNYITVRIVKAYNKDLTDIQALDDKAMWFYNTLNPGFGIFILLIMIFFWVTTL